LPDARAIATPKSVELMPKQPEELAVYREASQVRSDKMYRVCVGQTRETSPVEGGPSNVREVHRPVAARRSTGPGRGQDA
jgi:hypothetical protein